MALRDWLNDSDHAATATLATAATNQPKSHPNVATVATVAVATPQENEFYQGGDLPEACPLLGGPVPNECRFETKFFQRMAREGVFCLGGPCPLRKVCKLK
jgi:hypothetical protein